MSGCVDLLRVFGNTPQLSPLNARVILLIGQTQKMVVDISICPQRTKSLQVGGVTNQLEQQIQTIGLRT